MPSLAESVKSNTDGVLHKFSFKLKICLLKLLTSLTAEETVIFLVEKHRQGIVSITQTSSIP